MTAQPYQLASEENINQRTRPLQAAAGALSTGLAVAPALGMAGRILPFLSPHIPEELATKGLSKIDSRLGKFIDTAMELGQPFDVIKDFIKEKVESGQAKEGRNIIQQYSPNLFQYLSDLVKQGDTPTGAAAKARKFLDKKQQGIIDKIEKDHKASFADIVASIFGNTGALPQQGQNEAMQPPGSLPQGAPSAEAQAFGGQQMPQGQPQQGGQGQAALMAILQKIQQSRGGQ